MNKIEPLQHYFPVSTLCSLLRGEISIESNKVAEIYKADKKEGSIIKQIKIEPQLNIILKTNYNIFLVRPFW